MHDYITTIPIKLTGSGREVTQHSGLQTRNFPQEKHSDVGCNDAQDGLLATGHVSPHGVELQKIQSKSNFFTLK